MIVDVKLENFHNLECFKNILEKYRDYKSFYRELKINSLLGNKSQFDIDDINPPLICGFEDDTSSFLDAEFDNHTPSKLATTIFNKIHGWELSCLRKSKMMFGASCAVVLTKK